MPRYSSFPRCSNPNSIVANIESFFTPDFLPIKKVVCGNCGNEHLPVYFRRVADEKIHLCSVECKQNFSHAIRSVMQKVLSLAIHRYQEDNSFHDVKFLSNED